MQKEDQILEALAQVQKSITGLQSDMTGVKGEIGGLKGALQQLKETQDRTILAVIDLQSDMTEIKHTVSTLVTRDEYLTGQDQIIKRLDTLETEKASTDSYLKRIREKVGV